jgi:riboflavin kinase / FMN adenylyltransferase
VRRPPTLFGSGARFGGQDDRIGRQNEAGTLGGVEVVRYPGPCPALPGGSVVTIGAYDGVHLGHRAIIDRVRKLAADRGIVSALITFDQHPARLVRPESAPLLLTDPEQKLELLEATGLDLLLVVRFDEERSKESPEDFVREVLIDCLGTRTLVVGEDFHFGHKRRGNVELLRTMGAEAGFEVEGMDLLGPDGHVADEEHQVSSTAIRTALAVGDVERAAELLGRDHEVRGIVDHGDGRGGPELGFPTANVSVPDDVLLPADGIYAGWYTRPDGSRHAAAISLGRRPTFYETAHASLLEAHLLDFDDDLYGERAHVSFVRRLRGEVKFDSVDALIAQMRQDCDQARQVLAG